MQYFIHEQNGAACDEMIAKQSRKDRKKYNVIYVQGAKGWGERSIQIHKLVIHTDNNMLVDSFINLFICSSSFVYKSLYL